MATYNEVNPVTELGSSNRKNNANANANTNANTSSYKKKNNNENDNNKTGEDQWPNSLKAFVNDCFVKSNSLNKTDKIEFQNQLQKLMQKGFQENKIWENDWTKQKLPILDKTCFVLELYCNTKLEKLNDSKKTLLPSKGKLPLPSNSSFLPSKNHSVKRHHNDLGEGSDTNYLSERRKQSRMERFEKELNHVSSSSIDIEWGGEINKPLIGTCKDLEKGYLRLTSAPDSSRVRPLPILKKSLVYILDKFGKNKNYSYICDQFKSLRQDLTVQFIKNDFSVKVYETHARIAIDNNDLGEYNQCQSQLMSLYQLSHVKGENKFEFIAYRILYYIMTENHNDIYKLKLTLDPKSLKSLVIKDALQLHKSQLVGNYHDFFKLYSATKNKGKKLVSFFIEKERIKALYKISKTYKKIWLDFLVTELKFDDRDSMIDFLKEKFLDYCISNDENVSFDCAKAKYKLEELYSKISKKIDIKGQI